MFRASERLTPVLMTAAGCTAVRPVTSVEHPEHVWTVLILPGKRKNSRHGGERTSQCREYIESVAPV